MHVWVCLSGRVSRTDQRMEEADIFRRAPIFKEDMSFSSHKLQYPKNKMKRRDSSWAQAKLVCEGSPAETCEWLRIVRAEVEEEKEREQHQCVPRKTARDVGSTRWLRWRKRAGRCRWRRMREDWLRSLSWSGRRQLNTGPVEQNRSLLAQSCLFSWGLPSLWGFVRGQHTFPESSGGSHAKSEMQLCR